MHPLEGETVRTCVGCVPPGQANLSASDSSSVLSPHGHSWQHAEVCDPESHDGVGWSCARAARSGARRFRIYTELCRKEVDGFTSALDGLHRARCRLHAGGPLFTELAAGARASTELNFVNIREAAGWSAEGAAATPKIAALLALADLPEPEPAPLSSYEVQGRAADHRPGRGSDRLGRATAPPARRSRS